MNSKISQLRKLILKKLEKPRRSYEQRVYNNLDKLYSVIKLGDLVLVEGQSEMSRIIKLFTTSHWSHVAMYVGKALIDPDYKDRDSYLKRYGKDSNHMLIG